MCAVILPKILSQCFCWKYVPQDMRYPQGMRSAYTDLTGIARRVLCCPVLIGELLQHPVDIRGGFQLFQHGFVLEYLTDP